MTYAESAAPPRTRPPLLDVLAAEWTRLWTVRSTWLSFALAAVVMVGLASLLALDEASTPRPGPAPEAWVAGEIGFFPAQFALLLPVILAVTGEYATGAITTTLQWTPRRHVVVLARTVVTVGVAAALTALLALAADLAAWVLLPSAQMTVAGAGGSIAMLTGVLAATALLSVGIAFLVRSTAGALSAVFLLVLVLPVMLPLFGVPWLETLAAALPGAAVMYLVLEEGPVAMTLTSAAVTLAAWTAAALAAGTASFLRGDAT